MADPAILFVKPKAIKASDKKVLRDAGVVVVEVDDPASVKLVRATTELEGGALLRAAAEAIAKTGNLNSPREAFGRAVCAAIEAQFGKGPATHQ